MKLLQHILRILVGLVFIISAVAKLYPIEPFEIIFIDIGISNWLLAPFIARFVISFEIFLGLSILFNIEFKNAIYYLAQSSLLLFTVYLVYILVVNGNAVDCGCFGEWISFTPIESIIKNVLLFVALLLIKKENYSKGLRWVLPILFLVIAFTSTFLLNRVGLQNVQGVEINEVLDLSKLPPLYQSNKKVNFNEGKKIIAFLSVACKHCKSAAYKLAYLKKEKKNSNLILVVGSKKEENLQPFFDDTGVDAPFIWMNDDAFFKYSGGSLPAFVYVEDGVLKKKWTGTFFKVEELEELLKYNE